MSVRQRSSGDETCSRYEKYYALFLLKFTLILLVEVQFNKTIRGVIGDQPANCNIARTDEEIFRCKGLVVRVYYLVV